MRDKQQFKTGQSVTAREDYIGDNNLKLTKGTVYLVSGTKLRTDWWYVRIEDDNGQAVWLRERYFKVKLDASKFIEGWMT